MATEAQQRAQPLRKGREQIAKSAQEEKDKRINELRARLAIEDPPKTNLETTKKRTKEKSNNKKSSKKVRVEDSNTAIPKDVVVDFTPIEEVAAEELMEEEGPHMYTSTDEWEDEEEEGSRYIEPPAQKAIVVPPKRQTYVPPTDPRRVPTSRSNPKSQNVHPDPRLAKRPKPDPQPVVQSESTSPSYFSQVVDTAKYHGTRLVSRGAAQLTVFALGGVLLFTKNHLERLAHKYSQGLPVQSQAYIANVPPAQSYPSTPASAQAHNYPVQQAGHQSLESSPFGPRWQ